MRRSMQGPGAAILAAMTLGCMAGAAGQRGGRMGPPGGFGPEGTRYINPGTLAALDGFTHAVKVGLTIYISGEVPLDSTGHLVGPGDLRAQARQAFANLAFVLQIAGAAGGLKLMELGRLAARGHVVKVIGDRQFWKLVKAKR